MTALPKESHHYKNLQYHLRCYMMGSFEEFERDLIMERKTDGVASALARGRVGGRPKGLSPVTKQKASIASAL